MRWPTIPGDSHMEMKAISRRLAIAILLAALAQSFIGQSAHTSRATRPREYTFEIVRTFLHDPTTFTQ
jgi:glutamine cyclotransferase